MEAKSFHPWKQTEHIFISWKHIPDVFEASVLIIMILPVEMSYLFRSNFPVDGNTISMFLK
jgi:hypothetical protein